MFSELNQDSCSPTPSSKNVTLPPGCVLSGTNSSIVDVGQCEPVACLRNDTTFNSSCQDPSFCCGPRDFIEVLVDCGDIMSFNLSKVTHCSCGSCKEQVTIIQGIVLGGPQEKPVRYGDVIYNGKNAAMTDGKGRFSLTIPGKLKRVIVTFKDYFKEFEETNKVFVIHEGSRDFHKIKLRRIPTPVAFNASEPLDIPLGSESSGDSFADLELSAESFLAEDGSVFQGNAKAMIGVTDSRNLSDLLSAPGDFSTTNEEGEEGILETFGMVKLTFQDDSGKKLSLSKPMKVYLDPEKLNISLQDAPGIPLKLYWLDTKTERWREAGDFQLEDGSKRRKKRSVRTFFVGTITPTLPRDRSLNFDAPISKISVRVTATKLLAQQRIGVKDVVVRVFESKDGTYGGYTEGRTNKDGVACIPIWRDRTCNLQVEYDGRYIKLSNQLNKLDDFPKEMDIKLDADGAVPTVTFESKKNGNSENSPLYLHNEEVSDCQKPSGSPENSQFAFDVPSGNKEPIDVFQRNGQLNRGECYIKIKIRGANNVMFVAESYKEGDFTADTGKTALHLRGSKKVPNSDVSVVCLRFNCPTDTEYPYVKIAPLTKTCKLNLPAFKRTILFEVQFGQKISNKEQFSRSGAEAREPPKTKNPNAVKWLWIPEHSTGSFIGSQNRYNTFREINKGKGEVDKLCYNGIRGAQAVTDVGFALEYNCR